MYHQQAQELMRHRLVHVSGLFSSTTSGNVKPMSPDVDRSIPRVCVSGYVRTSCMKDPLTPDFLHPLVMLT